MPLRWRLRLADPVPPASPAQVHGLACRLLEDPHAPHTAQLKPFSAAGPYPDGPGADPALEVTWLDDARVPDVAARVNGGALFLGPDPLRVTGAERDAVRYTDLAAAEPRRRVRVRFTTPAYINRAGRQIPLPDPELLLSGLARRWSAFSPLPLPEDALHALLAGVHVADHRIRAVPVHIGPGRRVGFVGSVVFGLPSGADPAAARLLAALWHFAEYAGAGAQTTHGLGRVRVAESAGKEADP